MATSPRLAAGSASLITCYNTSLNSLPSNFSYCRCKHHQHTAQPSQCLDLLNFTSQPNLNASCAEGCPVGYRVYRTGSALTCDDPLYGTDHFILYESACQGQFMFATSADVCFSECVVAKCSSCDNSLTSCDQCIGPLLLTSNRTYCVERCPPSYYSNRTSGTCEGAVLYSINFFFRLW